MVQIWFDVILFLFPAVAARLPSVWRQDRPVYRARQPRLAPRLAPHSTEISLHFHKGNDLQALLRQTEFPRNCSRGKFDQWVFKLEVRSSRLKFLHLELGWSEKPYYASLFRRENFDCKNNMKCNEGSYNVLEIVNCGSKIHYKTRWEKVYLR